jgi:hypothetical protein
MQKPGQQIESIETKEDFASFVEALRLDLKDHLEEWENPTLESFLEAMQRWIESMDGWYANRGEDPPVAPSWRTFAHILYASKIYE